METRHVSDPDQACCCPARATVRVIMPPTPNRPNETDLLLCGHHFRVSWRALAAQHARVSKLGGSRVTALTGLYLVKYQRSGTKV